MLSQDQLIQLQTALCQLPGAPAATPAVLYPGQERYALIGFLLEKLLTPELFQLLLQRVPASDLPSGISADEEHAHRLMRVLQAVDFYATAEQVRGSGSKDDSLRLLASLASHVAKHQQYSQEASGTITSANTCVPSPGPSSMAGRVPGTPPRQRTPSKAGYQGASAPDGGSGGSGRLLLSLQSLDSEMRMLELLADKLPQCLEPSGGSNWFPGDIMTALQPYLPNRPLHDIVAEMEQRSQALRKELAALQAEEAQLASKVTFASDADWQRHAGATRAGLSELLETTAAFYHTFQTGLGVWCAASKATDTCGLGQAASDLLMRFETVQRLAADLARVRQAYTSIVSSASPLALLEQHTLSQLARVGQSAVEHGRAQNAAEQSVRMEAQKVNAASVHQAANMVQLMA